MKQQEDPKPRSSKVDPVENAEKRKDDKKRKKRNTWPLKALVISFLLAATVNVASNLVLEGARLWLSCLITFLIVVIGVAFDVIGTAATSCEVEPFLSMASRKVKGAKTAVKLSKKADTVSSVCCDIIGDVCGIVSGVCAATIVVSVTEEKEFWLGVLVYAAISTLTITAKAVGKRYAVNNANTIVFRVAKLLSIFNKEG